MSYSPDKLEAEKHTVHPVHDRDVHTDVESDAGVVNKSNPLHRDLKGRHLQMIAIGGAIGAGLFVGSGGALHNGGPASLVICYIIVGSMLLCTVQALGELAVLFPVNGAFYTYVVRFVDPSWGFAMGWQYAIQWLTVLPFELTAAGLTIRFWREDLNIGIWIGAFLALLIIIQVFGIRGYGEVEFVLSILKIMGCIGFIILGIIIDCGGTGPQGYIGAKYWHEPGAFNNGFKGFCSVFVVASFAFGGTELVGLAAAETANPRKSIPAATKQVFWRISFFYILSLFILGLIVPSDNENLLDASNASTKYSAFVIAIRLANIKVLPSIFNAIITISVISVANSCTFASTRTMQALAERGHGPKFLAYVDKKGRPVYGIIIQLLFGLIAFVGESGKSGDVFNWLLALSGLSNFFVWGSICWAHIRFRAAWKAQGHVKDELPYQAVFGVIGSWYGFGLNVLCLVASFYSALAPAGGGEPDVKAFFSAYLAAPVAIFLYLSYKIITRQWAMYIPAATMDVTSARRSIDLEDDYQPTPKTWKNLPLRVVRALF